SVISPEPGRIVWGIKFRTGADTFGKPVLELFGSLARECYAPAPSVVLYTSWCLIIVRLFMETLSIALSLWKIGLVSSEELIAWVDAQIQMSDNPDEVLVQLSFNGPETCVNRPIYEFPIRPIELTFTEEFGLRVSM